MYRVLSDLIEAYFRDGKSWDIEIQYSRDPHPLGTGGAVRYAAGLIEQERFFVVNGDSYHRFDLEQFVNNHIEKKALITMGLVKTDDCRRYGSVRIGKDGLIQAFQEKSSVQRSGLINAGTYLIERETVNHIPKERAFSLETDFFPRFVGSGLYAVIGEFPFLDIGTPESFKEADKFIVQELI